MTLPRRTALKLLSAAATAPLLSGCLDEAAAQEDLAPPAPADAQALGERLRQDVERRLRAQDVTGLSIALVDDQRVLWSHGAGWADREARKPATAQTPYGMGSVSKLFTVMAALQFAAQGRLDLDAPIQAVLPEFSIRSRFGAAAITPRLLMTHRAGLPRDVLAGMFSACPQPFEAMVQGLRDADLASPPGLLMSYSNVGLTVLGAAVERLAGKPFDQHLRDSLLQPLGMAQARFALQPGEVPDGAAAYDRHGRQQEPGLRDMPAGGLVGSVLDLAAFLSAVFAGGRAGDQHVLSTAWVDEMLRPQSFLGGLEPLQCTGLGWMLDEEGQGLPAQAGTLAHHSGATLYHRAQVMALPRHRLGVVVASNDVRGGAVMGELAREALRQALALKTGQPLRAPRPRRAPADAPMPEAALAEVPGCYATQIGFVKVERDGRRLKTRLMDKRLELFADAEGWLHPRYALLGLIPLPVPALAALGVQRRRVDGRDMLVLRNAGKEMLLGERIEPQPGLRWEGVAGRYEPVSPPDERRLVDAVEVFEEDGFLLARVHLNVDNPGLASGLVALRLLSDSEAIAPGPLADMGEVVRRVEVEGKPGFEFAGYRFRRVEG